MAKFYRINRSIQSQKLLVLDNQGNKLGELTRDEAIKLAEEQELDLVEIAPTARPPVAKILDFRKFLYEENKKEQISKKNAREVELKELWFSPRIGEHDLETRLRRMEQFLEDGNKVQFRVKFRGREMGNTKLGFALLQGIFERYGDKILVDRPPKLEGRSITTIIGRGKGASVLKPKVVEEKKVEASKQDSEQVGMTNTDVTEEKVSS